MSRRDARLRQCYITVTLRKAELTAVDKAAAAEMLSRSSWSRRRLLAGLVISEETGAQEALDEREPDQAGPEGGPERRY